MKKRIYGAVGLGIVAILSLGVNYSNPDIYGVKSLKEGSVNHSNPDIYG
ncbi:hypothetical protein [Bacillus thuringiensis]|nr:hypothetical protein [Bacillus thuringiensis]